MSDRTKTSDHISAYTTIVTLVGGGVILWALAHLPAVWPELALLASIAALAEWANIELYSASRSRVSLSAVVALASMLLFGPAGGVFTHTVSGVTTALTTALQQTDLDQRNRASLLQRTGFNIGMFVLSNFAAGIVYTSLAGNIGEVAKLSNLLPLILAVTTEHVVNIGLLMGVITLQTHRAPLQIWKENFMWAAPIATAGALIGSATLGLGYQYFGVCGLAFFLLPGLLIRYSYKLRLGYAKQVAS